MTSQFSLISSIRPGKTDWKLKIRILRLWYVPELKNPDEVNGIEMIVLDEKSEKIGLIVKKKYIPSFHKLLHEGATYILQNLLVALNDTKFQTTNHKFKLHFLDATGVLLVEATEIPKYHFDFMPFSEILAATNEDKLLDIIGQVVESNIKETENNGVRKKLIDIVIQDLQMKAIQCTLWGHYAEQMQQHLETQDEQAPVIIVLQLCKLIKFRGEMGISNAYFGTRIYLDPGLEVIKEYRFKMHGSELRLSRVVNQRSSQRIVSVSDEFLQMERKTILDLIEASETGFGSVLAQVVEVESESGWFYQSCFKCYKKVSLLNNKLYCANCGKSVIGFPRYMVHLKVIDKSASVSFVVFDEIVKDYIGKEAAHFVAITDKEIKLSYMAPPAELQKFVGKQYLFKVQIKDFNIYENRQYYLVKKISEDKELINKFITLHNIKLCNVEEEVDYMDALNNIAEENPLIVLEGSDSNSKPSVGSSQQIPTSKLSRKRTIAEM